MSGDDDPNDPLNNYIPAPTMDMDPYDLQTHLSGLQYPATKQSILAMLRKKGGLGEVVAAGEKVPDREYANREAVQAEFFKV